MISIDPNSLYTRADLLALLEGSGLDVDTFIARIRARKVFRLLWLGSDILDALRKAPALADRSDAAEIPKARRRGRGAGDRERPGAAIRREFLQPAAEKRA
jgi:hypothetical protein